jgi:hypothetical protein
MKPLISDEERKQAVRNFLLARSEKRAKIHSYIALVPYLNENRIKTLYKLKPSGGKEPILDANTGAIRGYALNFSLFNEDDAKKYFEWLVAVVDGTEEVTEDIVKQANDQLFRFIQIMNEQIEQDKSIQLIAPYNWQQLFLTFEKQLTGIRNLVDRHDKDISEILKSILEFLKTNKTLLETLQKDYEGYFQHSDKP